MLSTFPAARRARNRAVGVTLAAAAVLFASAAPAVAHDELVSSNPAAGATVTQAPAEVVLTFDEPVIPIGTQIVVTGPDGPVSDGSPRIEGTAVRQPLSGGPAGSYTVVWRATSADGHPVSGTFSFTAQAASPPSSTSSTSPTTTTSPSATAPSTTTSSSPTTSPTTSVTAAPTASSAASSPWSVVVIVLVVAALAFGGWAWYRRRNAADPGAT